MVLKQADPLKVLFICTENRYRSATAEVIFSPRPGLQVKSAGIDSHARHVLTADDLRWAQLIAVMEQLHVDFVKTNFSEEIRDKQLVCLNIPDDYEYLQPELVILLEERMRDVLLSIGRS